MPFQVQASVSALGKIPVVSLSIFVTVTTYLLAATQIQLPNVHLLTFSLACLTQLKSSSLDFSPQILDYLILPALYRSAPGVPIAGSRPTHTHSQQGCVGVWSSP